MTARAAIDPDSLAKPLHELRGALTVLQLGLPAKVGPDALAPQLERARLALDDVDACLEGRSGPLGGTELVELEPLVLRAARPWSELAPRFGAQVRVRWRAGAVLVVGHAARLGQALDNLIANAVEHGVGRVLVEGEPAGSKVRVAIVDRGRGVSLHAQHRAPKHPRRGHGLAITRDVIAAHGGELLFERRRRGAAVVIELPVARAAAGVSRREPSPMRVRPHTSPRAA